MAERTNTLTEDPAYTTEEAAEYLNLNARSMERWRTVGYGPAFIKLGRSVRYRRSSLDTFAQQQTRTHTGVAA